MIPKTRNDGTPRRRCAATVLGGGVLLLFVLTSGGCEQLVDYNLDTHGHAAVNFAPDVKTQPLAIASGDRRLAGVYVQAAKAHGPLLLIFHGDGEAAGDWSAAQTLLAQEGMSSLVFDYSGYGASTGRPTIAHLHEDARATYAIAARLAQGRKGGIFIVAHSLGCNVALEAAPGFSPPPVGYALWGVTPSLREYVATSGGLPRPLLFLIPDRWNNVRAAAALYAPVLVLHGSEDHVSSAAGARAVASRVSGEATFLEVAGADHNAIHRAPDLRVWAPIIAFAVQTSKRTGRGKPGDNASSSSPHEAAGPLP